MKKLTFLLFCLLIAGMQLIQAQGVAISGRTTDGTTGEALPGVTVQVKGTTVGAISQADGSFRIANVPAGSTTLVFSFVGYQSQEVVIAGRTVVDAVLLEEVTALADPSAGPQCRQRSSAVCHDMNGRARIQLHGPAAQ